MHLYIDMEARDCSGGGGVLVGEPTWRKLIRRGLSSDFDPYYAFTVVWEAGQGNDDSTLGTRQFSAAPLSPCWSSRCCLGLRLQGLQPGIWTKPKQTLC